MQRWQTESRKILLDYDNYLSIVAQENFETEFFDKIICYGVFDACYQENALYEMLRICKIGGNIFITGKNIYYNDDDEQAIIAEEVARKKGHPNYFTNIKYMLE